MFIVLLFNLVLLFGMLWLVLKGISVLVHIAAGIFRDVFSLDVFNLSCSAKKRIKACICAALAIVALATALHMSWDSVCKLVQHAKDSTVSAKYERYTR